MRFDAPTITTTVAVLTLLITIGSGMFYLGKLSNQVESLSVRIDNLHEEVRRNNEQLLHLSANHTHDENGNAVFTVPPGTEPTGAIPNQPAPTQ